MCHNSHDGLMNDSGKDVAILSQELNGNDKIPAVYYIYSICYNSFVPYYREEIGKYRDTETDEW